MQSFGVFDYYWYLIASYYKASKYLLLLGGKVYQRSLVLSGIFRNSEEPNLCPLTKKETKYRNPRKFHS